MACETRTLQIDSIRIDGQTQPRVAIDQATVDEYAEDMATGFPFPPVTVYHDGTDNWLADGFHRFHGARKAGLTEITARVEAGTVVQARWHACGANSAHGLRRSNADKRRAVEMALAMHPEMSDRAIAEHCKVSSPTVASVRSNCKTFTVETPRTGLDGKTRQLPSRPIPPPALPVKPSAVDGCAPPPLPPPPESGPPDKPPPESPKGPPKVLDHVGRAVPEKLVELWNRSQTEGQEFLTAVSHMRTRIKKARDDRDPLYAHMQFQSALAHLDQLYVDVKQLKAYSVCPSCHGLIGCRLCLRQGLIPQFAWDMLATNEQKAAARAEASGEK